MDNLYCTSFFVFILSGQSRKWGAEPISTTGFIFKSLHYLKLSKERKCARTQVSSKKTFGPF